jgi:hypothetical protein
MEYDGDLGTLSSTVSRNNVDDDSDVVSAGNGWIFYVHIPIYGTAFAASSILFSVGPKVFVYERHSPVWPVISVSAECWERHLRYQVLLPLGWNQLHIDHPVGADDRVVA